MDEDYLIADDDDEISIYKCRKHPSHRRFGVCPSCLRHRLFLLCPNCSQLRPCSCLHSSSSSSSSSSFSSLFSSFDPPVLARVSVSGAVGRISTLIDNELAFERSRSVAVPMEKGKKWGIWGFLKTKEKEEEIEKLPRSRSVGVRVLKGKNWSFLSPMRVFRLKKTAKVVQDDRRRGF